MRILVVGDDLESRMQVRSLVADQSVVDVEIENAEPEIRHRAPHVLVFVMPDSGGPEHIRAFSAADASNGMYIVSVVAENQSPRAVSSAFAAGSHDVLSLSRCSQELRARVNARQRLRRWMSARIRLDATSKSQPIPTSVLSRLCAWQNLGDVIADDLEGMFGRSLTIDEGWPVFADSIQLATISMTLAAEQLELCISIVADAATRRWLGENLLGDPGASDETLDDIMREMANLAGGALKRAARVEGPILSTGIPVDGRSLPQRESGARCWTVPLADAVGIAVIGEVRHRANRQIPARKLIEGMIVVNDVRNRAGVLLLPAGTRLTSTTADRLSNLLDLTLIEVSA